MLVIACLVIAGSLALRVESVYQVKPAEFVLPPLCMSRAWFGVSCPGCGLTRSFIYLAHGDWDASWQSHRLGWLLAAMVVLQVPYRIHGLRFPRKSLLSPNQRIWIGRVLIALLIGNWLLGLLPA